jgi:hypothetical protein
MVMIGPRYRKTSNGAAAWNQLGQGIDQMMNGIAEGRDNKKLTEAYKNGVDIGSIAFSSSKYRAMQSNHILQQMEMQKRQAKLQADMQAIQSGGKPGQQPGPWAGGYAPPMQGQQPIGQQGNIGGYIPQTPEGWSLYIKNQEEARKRAEWNRQFNVTNQDQITDESRANEEFRKRRDEERTYKEAQAKVPTAADFQIVTDRDGNNVIINKKTGKSVDTGISSPLSISDERGKELGALKAKEDAGTLTDPAEKARLNNLISGAQVTLNQPKPAPIGLYDKIDKAAGGAKVAQKLLGHFKENGAGQGSVGMMNSIWTYIEEQAGQLSGDKQVFIQDRTKMFSLIKQLNGEARLSDADLRFLQKLIPMTRQGEEAWVAALRNLHADSAQDLKVQMNRLDSNNYNIAEENRKYYNSLLEMPTLDSQQQTEAQAATPKTREEFDALPESKQIEILKSMGKTDQEIREAMGN